MTALKIIGIILLIFLLIGFLRLGAIISFGEELCIKLQLGAIKLTIFPGKERKPKKPKSSKEEKPKEEKPKDKKGKKGGHSFPKPTLEEILDLIETSFSALGATVRRACSRVRIDPLNVTVVFGGSDPALTAAAYGIASSIMFSVMPRAEEKFYIPDPSLHLRMDFDAESTKCEGNAGTSLRVCDLFAIMFTLTIPLLKWFLRLKAAHKNDNKNAKQPEKTENEAKTQDSEDKIA
ncbi:MAG: DUF2953 domain-containing protein [Oscillospiraceae bacterium]|nr:DUF2953 domain-containing protein [Oscillospiraceae bacterium]